MRVVLRKPIRDISNNLKLCRAESLKELPISSPDFAANTETGLEPILSAYGI